VLHTSIYDWMCKTQGNLMNIHLTHNQHTHVDCKKRLEIGE
jgi:hypothetical protein